MGITTEPISLGDLRDATRQFFNLHWCLDESKIADPPPEWNDPWLFQGTIPKQDKPGCYALLDGENIKYIGVGAGQAPGDYQHAGLGKRLHEYWRRDNNYLDLPLNERKYKPSEKYAEWLTGIITMGLDKNYGYLARALEAFLIARLDPQKNKYLKKSEGQ